MDRIGPEYIYMRSSTDKVDEPSGSTTHSKFIAEMKFLKFAMLVETRREKPYFMYSPSSRKF